LLDAVLAKFESIESIVSAENSHRPTMG